METAILGAGGDKEKTHRQTRPKVLFTEFFYKKVSMTQLPKGRGNINKEEVIRHRDQLFFCFAVMAAEIDLPHSLSFGEG